MTADIVTFDLTNRTLSVGSWTNVPVEISPGSGWKFDDLNFIIPKGACGGVVSTAREKTFDPSCPTIMLCAGYLPGKYDLLAVDKADKHNILGETQFVVRPVMGEGDIGPSLWFEGKIEGYVSGATWGGGGNGPENINITSHLGEWPVAILLVDTADHRYPDDEAIVQGFKDRWKKEAFSMDPGIPSVARYYDEISYGRLQITGEVFGPTHLPGNWPDYFQEWSAGLDIWNPYPFLAQACFTAADDLIDFSQYKSLVMVLPPTIPGHGVWPQAWGWQAKTADGDISYRVVVMPNEAPVPHPTLAHELGHNLGLPDLYVPRFPPGSSDVDMQNLGHWDLMHWEGGLPQMSILSRMAEGWIDPAWVKTYNFANHNPLPPVNETVSLHPLEVTPPPAGQYSGIEVRLAAGRNYYVEFHAPQTSQISDHHLPSPNHVIVTDASLPSPNGVAPFDRPRLMFVHKDSDGDGSILAFGGRFLHIRIR
jgi:M6 family metalloprotease-like protein